MLHIQIIFNIIHRMVIIYLYYRGNNLKTGNTDYGIFLVIGSRKLLQR